MLKQPIRLVVAPCAVLISFACAAQGNRGIPVDRPGGEIIHIVGDLYEGRSGTHNTVILVTSEGVIMADPIGFDFSQWLKAELADRFGTTVKYVIYSHHHPDHIAGGIVFADTATFVGHEGVMAALNAPLPSNAATLDLNGDGRIDRSEATGLGYGGASFDRYDRNGDGSITGVEINAETPPPDIVYSDHLTITLGGSSVELMHPGPAHSDDMTVLLFPEQRVVFGVDFMHVNRFPATLGGYPVVQYVDAVAKVQDLDFDIVIQGHGDDGVKADLAFFLDFLRALEAAVASGIAAGSSLDEMHDNLFFPDYEDWLLYDTRRVNLITEAYELLTGP